MSLTELEPTVDLRVFAGAFLLTVVVGLLSSLAPVLQARSAVLPGQAGRAASLSAGVSRNRLRAGLVVLQVALSLSLLVGALLIARTLSSVYRVDPGYRLEDVLSVSLDLDDIEFRYDDDRARAFFREALERVGALPGVRSAAWSASIPFGRIIRSHFVPEETPTESEPDWIQVDSDIVTPGVLRTMGLPLLEGRDFTDRDDDDINAPGVVMVNETLARTYWPGSRAIGKRVRVLQSQTQGRVSVTTSTRSWVSCGMRSTGTCGKSRDLRIMCCIFRSRNAQRSASVVPYWREHFVQGEPGEYAGRSHRLSARWDEQEVEFRMDAMPNVKRIESRATQTASKYEVKTLLRQRPKNVKQAIVREREYEHPHRVGRCGDAIRALDDDLPLYNARPLSEQWAVLLASQRSVGLLFLVSGLIALTLSAVGTYGMAASALASRRPELGLRMALGASARDVRRFVLDKGVKPLAVGLLLGLVASFSLSRFIEHLLIGVSARDTFAFVAGVSAMAMSGIAASYVPALRASRIDPATALRSE